MVQYQVQDPSGGMHIIEGPEGASPDDIVSQAQNLIPHEKPETGLFGQELKKGNTSASEGFKQDVEGPGLRDVSVPDAMAVEGAASLGKLGLGLAAKGVGAALDAIPATENVIPTIRRIANNQTLKNMGGSFSQIRQMAKGRGGREALDQAGEFARDSGLSDVFSTGVGREKQLEALKDASGKLIGATRDEAGKAPPGIIDKIVSSPKIDKYLGEGSASSKIGGVDKALADIREVGGSEPTHSSLADAATFINKEAAGNKMYQPVTAETEVANLLSQENDANIAQSAGSDKAQKYVQALEDQTKLHPLEHLQEHGELREASSRGGGVGAKLVQEIADSFGYRMSAKMAGAIHDALSGRTGLENIAGTAGKAGSKLTPAAINEAISRYLKNERTP